MASHIDVPWKPSWKDPGVPKSLRVHCVLFSTEVLKTVSSSEHSVVTPFQSMLGLRYSLYLYGRSRCLSVKISGSIQFSKSSIYIEELCLSYFGLRVTNKLLSLLEHRIDRKSTTLASKTTYLTNLQPKIREKSPHK